MSHVPATRDPGNEALADALRVSFRLLRVVMVILLALYVVSGIFIVKQDEKAIVLVFGKVAGAAGGRVGEGSQAGQFFVSFPLAAGLNCAACLQDGERWR